jgi:hypothetical protein
MVREYQLSELVLRPAIISVLLGVGRRIPKFDQVV